jgi:putrescine---pyruvate transaminase
MDTPEVSNALKTTREHNARHMLHPFSLVDSTDKTPPLIIERGQGSFIYDIDGRAYLDAVSSLWNVNVGHNHAVVNRAIVEQLEKIAYYKIFTDTSNAPAIELSRKVMELAEPEGMVKLFFGSGGSDAVETALKLARQYWKIEGEPQRHKIISLKGGYHGVHFGGMSAGGNPLYRRAYEPMVPGFFQVERPFTFRNIWNEEDPSRLAKLCAEALEREILNQSPETVAAFIAEPIQGAGGVIIPPDEYWPLIRGVCDRYNVLLIADEVITGFGRTGMMFGSRLFKVKPDLMCFAKGINSGYLPLGATAVNARIESAFHRDHPMVALLHGYTTSGHALACASGVANLKVIEDEKLLENATAQGAYLHAAFLALAKRFDVIGNVRVKGLMGALELVIPVGGNTQIASDHPVPRSIQQSCLQRGVIVRNQLGTIEVSPPLNVKRSEMDMLLNALEDSFAEALGTA